MKEQFVNMGQLRVMRAQGVLVTVGLGSCIGVTLYDPVSKVGGMGHVFLAKSRNSQQAEESPGKYADSAIPALIESVVASGGRRSRLVAKLAGGAHLFPNLGKNSTSVGDQNIKAVVDQLRRFGIPIRGKDVAGNHGRKMKLYVDSGVVEVSGVGRKPVEI